MASNHGPAHMVPPPHLMVHSGLNRDIGDLIGYLTLAVLCLVALIKIPSFLRYRFRAISRPPSFKSKGYYLSQAHAINTAAPSNKNILNNHSDSQSATGSPILGIKWKLIRLGSLKIRWLGNFNLGTLSLMLVYMIILVVLSLYKNTYDGLTVSKYRRFGYISIAQFPLLFVLAMKNSPLSIVTGVGYEKLNFFHRFVGRMIFVFGAIHGALQVALQYDLTKSIHFKEASLYGLIALCAFAAMTLMGIPFLRNSFYQSFLVIHILGYLTVIVALWKHSKSTRPYLAASIAFLAFDNLLKMFKSRVKRATFTAMPAGLTRIEVQGINNGWRAGQHIFIRVLKGKHILEKHPFTIANAPNSSTPYGSTGHLLLVVKAAGDFTQAIHRLAGPPRQSYLHSAGEKSDISVGVDLENKPESQLADSKTLLSSDVSYRVLVDGPYGTFFTDMTRYRTVLLCAGGSGFTYCMAALEDIIGEAVKSGASLTKHIFVVWSLREPDMLKCFGRDIEETIRAGERCGINVTVQVFLTKGGSQQTSAQQSLSNVSVEYHFTRPDLNQIIGNVINGTALITGGGLGVGACGPIGLVDSVAQGVHDLNPERVKQMGGVKLHTERFGW